MTQHKLDALRLLLEEKAQRFNSPGFIADDPISVPHQYTRKQDVEIAGFFAATLAWGQRKIIIANCYRLMNLMDDAPYDFIMNHRDRDLKKLLDFKHRTFNSTDLLYFIEFLSFYYKSNNSLEDAFISTQSPNSHSTKSLNSEVGLVKTGLINFHHRFFSLEDFPQRTRKHVSTPERKSACKRLNMYLRWMVRSDNKGVDFGIWKKIKPSQLICPCDVHVVRVARKLGLIKRKPIDWETAEELTANLRKLDANDPVKYDFALFGMGLESSGKWTLTSS